RYSDQISLSITVGALLWSGITALRAARRRARRGRIETHIQEAQGLADELRGADTLEALQVLLEQIEALRGRLFAELAAERLEANDAFSILQSYLDVIRGELDRKLAKLAA